MNIQMLAIEMVFGAIYSRPIPLQLSISSPRGYAQASLDHYGRIFVVNRSDVCIFVAAYVDFQLVCFHQDLLDVSRNKDDIVSSIFVQQAIRKTSQELLKLPFTSVLESQC